MEKNILNEINRAREIMGLSQLLNEGVPPARTIVGDIIADIATKESKEILQAMSKIEEKELDEMMLLLKKGGNITPDESSKLEDLIKKFGSNLNYDGQEVIAKNLKNLDVLNINEPYNELVKLAAEGQMTQPVFLQKVEALLATTKDEITDSNIADLVKSLYRESPGRLKQAKEIAEAMVNDLELKFPGIFTEQETGFLIKKNVPVYKQQIEQLQKAAEKQLGTKTKTEALNDLKFMARQLKQDIELGNIPPKQKTALKKLMEEYPKLFTLGGILGVGALLLWLGCLTKPKTAYCVTNFISSTAVEGAQGVFAPIKDLNTITTNTTIPTNTTVPTNTSTTTAPSFDVNMYKKTP